MEKSLEQLKHIERISRQTRQHRTYLNQICDQNLRTQLNQLANEREQTIRRSASRRQLEEERKQLLNITVKQIARERQHKPLSINTIQTEEETVQVLSKKEEDSDSLSSWTSKGIIDQLRIVLKILESRPSSSVQLPSTGKSCRLFSHNCQLYPCQPIHHYTSIMKKEHDQTLRKRDSSTDNSTKTSDKPSFQDLLTTIQEKKHQSNRRQLAVAIQNQHHLVNRHVSMQRTMTTLDEQSRLLHERLAEKKTFGYVKERQHRLSQAIQRHLKITAKFCA